MLLGWVFLALAADGSELHIFWSYTLVWGMLLQQEWDLRLVWAFSLAHVISSQKMGLITGKLLASPGDTHWGRVTHCPWHRFRIPPSQVRNGSTLSVSLFTIRALCKKHQATPAHLPGCDLSPWGHNSPGWEEQSDVHWLWHCAWIKARSQEA